MNIYKSTTKLTGNNNDDLHREIIFINYKRIRTLSLLLIAVSIMVLILIDIPNMHKGFETLDAGYLVLFHLHLSLGASMLIFSGLTWSKLRLQSPNVTRWDKVLNLSFSFTLAVICALFSANDQLINGQITLYILGLFIVAIGTYIKPVNSLLIYISSYMVFLVGITKFQNNSVILQGHYGNSAIIIIIAWFMSTILYNAKVKEFIARRTIEQANIELYDLNRNLEDKVTDRTRELTVINTELSEANQTLSYRSYHDSLTGLPNRASINELISNLLTLDLRFAILFLDLDNFKHINDSLGHSMGDILLKKIGQHLQSVVRSTDIVARLGGDEFMIILKEIKDRENVAGIAQHIIDSFRTSIKLNDYDLVVSTSIGIVLYPDDGEDMESLVKKSDIAMYEAKKQGRNRYCFFKGNNDNEVINRLKLISHLHSALEKDEFRLYFQPKFDINTLNTTGGEVLMRWVHPEMGLILPGTFISLAEESGLIIPIGEWIIKNSFQQIKAWSDHYDLGNIRISINISPLQFLQNNLISFIKDCLDETKLEAKYLEIEITESIALQNSVTVLTKLRQIKELGIEISMDDFGTGYSSMSYLSKYPIDTLKIDISFVRGLAKNKENQAIVTAIIAMAHSLNLKVIAEGVETEEQIQILREKKCDFGQGYFFGRPMSASDFEEKFIKTKVMG